MRKTAEQLRIDLIDLLQNFDQTNKDLREKVLAIVPAWDLLSGLGKSLIPDDIARSGRDRILHYFLQYPCQILSGKELAVVAGMDDWPRRVRELRREHGWMIASGLSLRDMLAEGDLHLPLANSQLAEMTPNDYLLLSDVQDREAAHRWHIASEVRRSTGGAKSKILTFLLQNIGQTVSGEELRYVTKDKSEWARRTRELRTEDGWQICTHWNGRPDLAPGMYVLESDRQLPAHDRSIDDRVRRATLRRDHHTCQHCGWSHDQWNRSDPRHLELHHREHHADGGGNEAENLVTVCNVCHDGIHRHQINV